MSKKEPVDFRRASEELSIIDFCLAHNYSIDRSRTTKKHTVMVDNADGERIIVVKTPKGERFFIAGIQSVDNIVVFIKNRLHKFFSSGKDDWEQVSNILRNYMSNAPTIVATSNEGAGGKESQFNVENYKLKPIYKFDYLNGRWLETSFLDQFKNRIFNNPTRGKITQYSLISMKKTK